MEFNLRVSKDATKENIILEPEYVKVKSFNNAPAVDLTGYRHVSIRQVNGTITEPIIPSESDIKLYKEGIDESQFYKEDKGKKKANIFSTITQVEEYVKENKIIYDKNGLFWEWTSKEYRYTMTDEINLLNGIRENMNIDTVDSKKKNEIISALKQVGRKQNPKPKPKAWIQFKEDLLDFKTGKRYRASPEYFLTNPIPHKLGNSKECPTILRLFKEWVVKEGIQDESWVKTLIEATAYGFSDELFMQRWFALTGAGMNGKGTWERFMQYLIGKENCVAINLKKLSNNNFALSSIYKKPVAFAGEVSYSDLTNTNTIKTLTGEDLIEFEFKGKGSFSDESITTIYVLTNTLPNTPDKSVGFYRRVQNIDFPNQFDIKPDLLAEIPEEEYENFCLLCVETLQELYKTKRFTNEGTISDREKRYEDKSNPMPRFIEENCQEELSSAISLQVFTEKFNEWLKNQRLRILNTHQVGAMLRTEGYQIGNKKVKGLNGDTSVRSVYNLIFRDNKNNNNNIGSSQILHEKTDIGNVIINIPDIPNNNLSLFQSIKKVEPSELIKSEKIEPTNLCNQCRQPLEEENTIYGICERCQNKQDKWIEGDEFDED
jgi:P4 family phage/plasmid primase-like protien